MMSTWASTPHIPVSRVFSVQAFDDAVQKCRHEVRSRLGPETLSNDRQADTTIEDPLDVSDLTTSNLSVAKEKIDRAVALIKTTDQWKSALRRDRTRPSTSVARASIVSSLADPHVESVLGAALGDTMRYSGHLGRRGHKKHVRLGWERNYKHEVQSRRVLVKLPESQGQRTAPRRSPHSESSNTDGTPVVLQICMFRGNHKRRLVRKFEILSSQTLTDLLDSRNWFCGTDEHVLKNRPVRRNRCPFPMRDNALAAKDVILEFSASLFFFIFFFCVLKCLKHIPESFFLIGDTFFFDDRVEDPQRPGSTTAATVARMMHRRNIGFAPPNNNGGDGGADTPAHIRQDGDTVHSLGLWERFSALTQQQQQQQRGSNPQPSAFWTGLNSAPLSSRGIISVGDFFVCPMSGVRLASLNIQLGASYLYFHQGNCEHTFCFVDAFERPRLLENPPLYPRMVFRRKIQIRRCSVCSDEVTCRGALDGSLRDAAFVTFEDPLAGKKTWRSNHELHFLGPRPRPPRLLASPALLRLNFDTVLLSDCLSVFFFYVGSNPCFFCTQCYWDLHYSAGRVVCPVWPVLLC